MLYQHQSNWENIQYIGTKFRNCGCQIQRIPITRNWIVELKFIKLNECPAMRNGIVFSKL